MIAKIDEQQAPMIAYAVHPAGDPDGDADIFFAQLAAGLGAIGMHHSEDRIEVSVLRREQRMGRAGLSRRAATPEQSAALRWLPNGGMREIIHAQDC